MKDRHLFRGLSPYGKGWIVGLLRQDYNPLKNVFYMVISEIQHNDPDIKEGWFRSGHGVPVNPETIGQCTGMRDKNGILIF